MILFSDSFEMSATSMTLRSGKRKLNNCNGSLAKKPKYQKPQKQAEPLRIIDLNNDCLEHVFKYLNVTDLNNVATSHGQFASAAHSVYKHKYRHQTLTISNAGHELSIGDDTNKNSLSITPSAFLRNFGEFVSKLTFDYGSANGKDNGHHWRQIERDVFKYCSKTLNEIILMNCHGNVMEEIRKPFTALQKLRVFGNNMNLKMIQTSKWFPQMYVLSLNNCTLRSIESIQGIRSLIRLRIRTIADDKIDDSDSDENLRQIIKSNQQIKDLFIDAKFKNWIEIYDFLQFLSQTLNHLGTLRMYRLQLDACRPNTHIHFVTIRKLVWSTRNREKFPDNLHISFNQLKTLDVRNFDQTDNKWNEFISQNQHLVELGYFPRVYYHSLDQTKLLEIMSELPQLTSISIKINAISPSNLKQLLYDCEPLTNLNTLQLVSFSQSDNFEGYLIDDDDGRQKLRAPSFEKSLPIQLDDRRILMYQRKTN